MPCAGRALFVFTGQRAAEDGTGAIMADFWHPAQQIGVRQIYPADPTRGWVACVAVRPDDGTRPATDYYTGTVRNAFSTGHLPAEFATCESPAVDPVTVRGTPPSGPSTTRPSTGASPTSTSTSASPRTPAPTMTAAPPATPSSSAPTLIAAASTGPASCTAAHLTERLGYTIPFTSPPDHDELTRTCRQLAVILTGLAVPDPAPLKLTLTSVASGLQNGQDSVSFRCGVTATADHVLDGPLLNLGQGSLPVR